MTLITEILCAIIIGLITILGLVYLYVKKCSFNYWKKLGVPYIEPMVPFGNVNDTIKLKKSMGENFMEIYNTIKAEGHNHSGIYFFNKPFYMALTPDMIKNIMSKDFQHFYDRGVYYNEDADPLSAHLFSLNGLRWKNLRAKLTPTFTSGKLKKMFDTLVECSLELKDCLNESINKSEPINIKQFMMQYTTDVIGSCAFGIECNSFKNPDTDFIRLGQKIFNPPSLERLKSFFCFLFPSCAKFLNLTLNSKDVDQFYREIVKDTIEYREKNNITRNDFMQLLIQLKNKGSLDEDEHTTENKSTENQIGTTLTLNEATAQAFVFFIAGFETSSTVLTFTLFELSQNLEIQEKLRGEVMKVLKKHDGQITYNSISEMHYMDRVVQEAMRKYPPIMILQRIVTKDYKIPDTDIVLKKDLGILISVLGVHRDPEYYPDPDRFEPDRFTEENIAARPDFTYLPFGDGPRVCIGLRFGMMQIKVGLCQLIKNYKFTLNPKMKLPLKLDPNSFVSSPKDGVWLSAEKIN